VSFAAITLCVATQRVFIIASVYFIIDSVRKRLDKPSYVGILFAVYEVIRHKGVTFGNAETGSSAKIFV